MQTPNSETGAVPQLYIAPCATCGQELQAHAAEWCHCVAKRVTPVCTHCGSCLCKSPDREQRQFWQNAPAWLKASRDGEQRRRAAIQRDASVERVDVLIVDDDEEIRMLAAYSVEQMGYTVTSAVGGKEALALLESVKVRVVITDALMPGMDGRQLCQMVKAGHPDVKVVIMTSLYTAPRYKHEAFKTFRADEYLSKPIDFSELSQIMARISPIEVNS